MSTELAVGPLKLVRESTYPEPTRVLLVHGLGNSWRVWNRHRDPQSPWWAGNDRADLELWAGDLPWRGDDAGWAQHPDPAHWIAEAIGAVPGGADVVVAHSYAATMLLDLATGPARDQVLGGIRGMVLVSPFYKSAPDDFTWDVLSRYMNGFVHIMADGIRVSGLGRPISEDIVMAMAERVQDRVGPYGWVKFFDTYLRSPAMRLDHLDIPCQIISGAGDIAAPWQDSVALAEGLPDATLTLLDYCGHFPMIEAPDRFGAAIDNFHHRIQLTPLGST